MQVIGENKPSPPVRHPQALLPQGIRSLPTSPLTLRPLSTTHRLSKKSNAHQESMRLQWLMPEPCRNPRVGEARWARGGRRGQTARGLRPGPASSESSPACPAASASSSPGSASVAGSPASPRALRTRRPPAQTAAASARTRPPWQPAACSPTYGTAAGSNGVPRSPAERAAVRAQRVLRRVHSTLSFVQLAFCRSLAGL